MDLLPNVINTTVLLVMGALVTYYFKGRFDAVDGRFEGIDKRLGAIDSRIDRFEDRVDARFAQFEARFGRIEATLESLRSDLLRVALVVGAEPRPQAG